MRIDTLNINKALHSSNAIDIDQIETNDQLNQNDNNYDDDNIHTESENNAENTDATCDEESQNRPSHNWYKGISDKAPIGHHRPHTKLKQKVQAYQ